MRRHLIWFGALILALWACDEPKVNKNNNLPAVGEEGGPCHLDQTCNHEDLVCQEDVCVAWVDPCADVDCGEAGQCRPSPTEPGVAECVCREGAFTDLTGACTLGDPLSQREFFAQALPLELETRYYYIYIPSAYAHDAPAALLMDLHGTAGDDPELAYGLEAAKDAAEAFGFVLVRPRSRSSSEGGWNIYRWDQNQGDTERNQAFITELVTVVSRRVHLDPERLYLMGFSSGTNQTARALADAGSPFTGFGFVGGGLWIQNALQDRGRVYLATGFRDYMRTYHYNLESRLDAVGFPPERRFVREFDGGHELYGFFYPEMFEWFDVGKRPGAGEPTAGWVRETFPGAASLTTLAMAPDGAVFAAGTGNGLFRRLAPDVWEAVPVAGTSAFPGRALTDLCFTDDGTGLGFGEGQLLRSADGGATWEHRPKIGEVDGPYFGYQFLNGAACAGPAAVGTGYWQGARSVDGGLAWTDVAFDADYGQRAQGAAVAVAPWGTWVAGGYWQYLGRSADGASFIPAVLPVEAPADWYYDLAWVEADRWIAVGDFGTILASDDDGASWSCVVCDGAGENLYAVAFSGDRGLAVGQHGAARLTLDGGLTWTDAWTGLDAYLGDARWLSDTEVLIAGEAGTVLRLTVE